MNEGVREEAGELSRKQVSKGDRGKEGCDPLGSHYLTWESAEGTCPLIQQNA